MLNLKLFNSTFENELRLILLIDVFEKPQNADMLYAADFMVVYGKSFSITTENLNGDNAYKFSEFLSRRALVQKVLKELSWKGLVKPLSSKSGIVYQITLEGQKFSHLLDSEYATEYRNAAKQAVLYVGRKSERTLLAEINELSATSLKEVTE